MEQMQEVPVQQPQPTVQQQPMFNSSKTGLMTVMIGS